MKKKILKLTSLLLIAFSLCAVSCGAQTDNQLCWYIKRRGSSRPEFPTEAEEMKKYDVYYIDEKLSENSEEKKIYITFDAGYENGNIEKIMDTLKNESVPAAFFLLDNIILKNTDLVKRMANEGHFICNHTKNHKNLSNATDEQIATDLTSLELLCLDKTGIEMNKYFRFPEGVYSENALKAVNELGYKTVFWSFAYEDWDNAHQMSEKKAIDKIISNTHNGAVMLFHPTSTTNAKIFPTLIKKWKEMGYSFGTLDELTT